MVEFERSYKFENSFGKFEATAKTYGNGSGYGNGMSMRVVVKCLTVDVPDSVNDYDIRYEPVHTAKQVDELARQIIGERYGVEL